MKTTDLYLFSIIPLDTDHIDEICQDIRRQYEDGVATCALFKMTLVPEGNPPAPKAQTMCAQYRLFQEKLNAMGIASGVLIQASLGHDRKMNELFPYQQYIGISDGAPHYVCCPFDKGFQDYMYEAARLIASCNPQCIMVDDDFRIIARPGRGCICPLHMKRFRQLTGTEWTSEELQKYIYSKEPKDPVYVDAFIETQKESLLEMAKAIRAGIDSINPDIPGSFCCVDQEMQFADEIADILAGPDHLSIVRIGNGYYTAKSPREIVKSFYRAATQIRKLHHTVDVILAETDTCPHNRYSLGAMSLHSHLTGTILEGACGAKHWITRTAAYEPESGKAYRKVLKTWRGFYETLSSLVPTLHWRGLRIPVASASVLTTGENWGYQKDFHSEWCNCVLDRLGLPMYFSEEPSGVLCLEGDGDTILTDEEMLEALKATVFLASDSARHLIERGFGSYLGVDVREISGKRPNTEQLSVNNNQVPLQRQVMELIPLSEHTREDSTVYHVTPDERKERLFPGTTVYKNSLGGTAVVFSGTPKANFTYAEAFSFLNYSRKLQLIRLLQEADELPVYYPHDEEVYFRAADMEDGNLFCSLINLGLDPIDQVELVCQDPIKQVRQLLADGSFRDVSFTNLDSTYTLETICVTHQPLILILTR